MNKLVVLLSMAFMSLGCASLWADDALPAATSKPSNIEHIQKESELESESKPESELPAHTTTQPSIQKQEPAGTGDPSQLNHAANISADTSPAANNQAEINPVPNIPTDGNLQIQAPKSIEEQEDIIILEWSRDLAKDYVETLNDGVDSFFMGAFFDDEIINDESSGSNGRLFLTTRRVQGEGVDYQVGVNLKLVLPKTRDRFKLLVETDENEDDQKETDLINTTANVTYSTAIRIELRDGKRWKSSLDNGIRWSGKPVYFSRIRARRTDYFDEWRLRVLQSITWRSDVEWGAKFNAGLLRPIDLHRHFRTGFTADYLLSDDFAELQTSAAIFEQLDERAALLYQLAVFGDTEHIAKVSNYVLTFSYRRKIYKSFVFAEIVPEVAWPREDDYEATPAINLRFEMIIGPDAH